MQQQRIGKKNMQYTFPTQTLAYFNSSLGLFKINPKYLELVAGNQQSLQQWKGRGNPKCKIMFF